MKNTETKRIAIHRATGLVYVVQQLDIRTGKVHCWGQLVSYRGLATKHAPSVSFDRAEVELGEMAWTQGAVRGLLTQAQLIEDAKQGPVDRRANVALTNAAVDAGLLDVIAKLVRS